MIFPAALKKTPLPICGPVLAAGHAGIADVSMAVAGVALR